MSHVDHLVKVCGGEALEGVPHHGEGEQRGEVLHFGEGEANLARRRRVRHLVAAHVQLGRVEPGALYLNLSVSNSRNLPPGFR